MLESKSWGNWPYPDFIFWQRWNTAAAYVTFHARVLTPLHHVTKNKVDVGGSVFAGVGRLGTVKRSHNLQCSQTPTILQYNYRPNMAPNPTRFLHKDKLCYIHRTNSPLFSFPPNNNDRCLIVGEPLHIHEMRGVNHFRMIGRRLRSCLSMKLAEDCQNIFINGWKCVDR